MLRSARLVTTILGSFVIASTALAFQAPNSRVEHVPTGAEWIAGHGDLAPNSDIVRLPPEFAERYGVSWTHREHGPNGVFRHLWGKGVDVDPAVQTDERAAEQAAKAFWRDNAYLFPGGASESQLVPWSNQVSGHTRFVSHQQTLDGVPVLRAGTFVAMSHGRIVWMGVRCFPHVEVNTTPSITAEQATDTAMASLRDLGASAVPVGAKLAIAPSVLQDDFAYRLVWVVELDSVTGRWSAYVDAHDDILWAMRDERMFLDATVEISHHDRNPGGAVVSSPARYMTIEHSDGADTTDAAGMFTSSGSNTAVSLEPEGTYTRVNNLRGEEITAYLTDVEDGDVAVWEWQATEYEQAQQDAYRFTNDVRDFAAQIAPDIAISDERITVNVNYDDECNAWYDGDITTLSGGSWCNNTAMVADVIYHEYGHGFHWYSIVWGVGDWDGAVGEGFADAMAFLQTRDHYMSPYFGVNGEYIRDVEENHVYPDDIVGEVHEDGLIVGGAIWDLRTVLIADLGEEAGEAVVASIFAGMAEITSDIPSTYEAALVTDDDNGDLNDGTPHVCSIDAAFGPHGLLGDGAQAALRIDHEPVTNILEHNESVELTVSVAPAHPECLDSSVGDVRLHWSDDAGETWYEQEMDSLGGEEFTTELPARPWGTQLRYRIEADEMESGTIVSRPYNEGDPGYYVYVGELTEILCDDFESGEGEWTHELISGEVSDGADDWMLGSPTGNGGDPDDAYSGNNVWGNDLAVEENWDGKYQNNKINALYSPTYDLTAHDTVRLQFRRWLGVEDAVYDFGRIYVNGTEVWTNAVGPGDVHHQDSEWILFDLDITEWAANQSSVQIKWEIESDPGLQFGGWTLDDVCFYEMVENAGGDDDDDSEGDDDDYDGNLDDYTGDAEIGGDCECRTGSDPGSSALTALSLLGLLLLRRR
jgi:MYXO-CTERM domain-containing protein